MSVRGAIRMTIGVKIFGIAVGLLVLMGAVAWINLHMTRTVDAQNGLVMSPTTTPMSRLLPRRRLRAIAFGE